MTKDAKTFRLLGKFEFNSAVNIQIKNGSYKKFTDQY